MKKNASIEDEINEALDYWNSRKMIQLLEDIGEIFYIYYTDVDEKEEIVGQSEEDYINTRLIRTVYLISRLSEKHAGALATFKLKFPRLYERMQREVL